VRAGTKTSVLPGGAIYWTQTDLKNDSIAGFFRLISRAGVFRTGTF
jgi:hypothetical protein